MPPPSQPSPQPVRVSPLTDQRETALSLWDLVGEHRVLTLVGGLWFVLVCLIFLAYSRLIFTGVPPSAEKTAAASPSAVAVPVDPMTADPAEAPARPEDPISSVRDEELLEDSPDRPTAPASPEAHGVLSLGLLMALVGGCALGCGGIMGLAQMAAKPRQQQLPKPTERLVPRSPSPRRRTARRTLRPPAPVEARPVSRREAVPPPAPQQPTPPPPAPPPAESPATLVAAEDTHPLDWDEASIAHTLDLRQRRSLSSFM